jgi:hypothetical protein
VRPSSKRSRASAPSALLLAALIAGAGFSACDANGSDRRPTEPSAPAATADPERVGTVRVDTPSARVTARCRQAGRKATFPLLCPRSVPARAAPGQILTDDGTAYQWELMAKPMFGRRGAAHALFGGQASPFTLNAGRPREWVKPAAVGAIPALQWLETCPSCPPEGGLQVLRRLRVAGRPALALKVGGGRDGRGGGPHGGHVVLIFNIDGAGYFSSVHFDKLLLKDRLALATAFARSLHKP